MFPLLNHVSVRRATVELFILKFWLREDNLGTRLRQFISKELKDTSTSTWGLRTRRPGTVLVCTCMCLSLFRCLILSSLLLILLSFLLLVVLGRHRCLRSVLCGRGVLFLFLIVSSISSSSDSDSSSEASSFSRSSSSSSNSTLV